MLDGTQPWPAPAKLNLFLHVTGRRADGYHRLQTLFQFLDYGDTLLFTPNTRGELSCSGGPPGLPPEQELCLRAARLLREASGAQEGADIQVHKRIPLGGGLGGGSSNAATTLVALNQLWGCGLTTDALAALGLQLGADVPVFVRGHAAWAEGVGEILRPCAPPEPWYVVLTPPVAVSTAEIFGAPELRRDHAPVTETDFAAGRCVNDCEPVTFARHPQVAAAHAWLSRHAPARMSGTGASVFAAFDTRAAALAVAAQAPSEWRNFVAAGLNRSPLAGIIRRL